MNIKGEEEGKGWCPRNRKCEALGNSKHKRQKGKEGRVQCSKKGNVKRLGALDIKDKDEGGGGGVQEIRNTMHEGIGSSRHKRQRGKGVGVQETRSVKCEGTRSYGHKQRKGRGGVEALETRSVMELHAYTKKRKGGIKALEIRSVKRDVF